ncbi:MAG: glycosyl hydrolase [Verrucomicrobiales bacterium]|nr:glycosyl hydrolase [Verrucomicrobiales bacterium]
MPLHLRTDLTPSNLRPDVLRLFELSARKIQSLNRTWKPSQGTPVFTRAGRYTSRGWTEWTQGFQYGACLLQFDAVGGEKFLELGRSGTVEHMATHVSHVGVHDHGFNNVSTYGNLRRLMREGRIPHDREAMNFYELALKVSGAVQAARWTELPKGQGFIYSFNGPHSLFIDTMRSLRSLAIAHQLGHPLMAERDRKISLLQRLVQHALTTADYAVYFGQGRDAYDVPGRVAHESIFNLNDGSYRCPNSQQGYSPFTTWTRGLAWALLGFAEQLEFLSQWDEPEIVTPAVLRRFEQTAMAAAERYLEDCCTDGIPVWDTGAPQLHRLGAYAQRASDPYNAWEPVDSSAAAIAAQGFLVLGRHLIAKRRLAIGRRYHAAGLTIARTLFRDPYLSVQDKHQGLILHSIYHRPNGWDYIVKGQKVPNGESSMWGDYHARELGLLILREAEGKPALRFWA